MKIKPSIKNIKFSLLFILATIMCLLLIFYTSKNAAHIQHYFNSGADLSKIFKRSHAENLDRFLNTKWVKSKNNQNKILKEIAIRYSQAWQLKTNKDFGRKKEYLEEFFDRSIVEKILNHTTAKNSVTDIIYGHSLELKSISKDNKLVVFIDKSLKNLKIINKNSTSAVSIHLKSQAHIIMAFMNSKWKIISLSTKETNPIEFIKTKDSKPLNLGTGINYYPSKTPWEEFWPEFNKNKTSSDFKKIKNANFKNIRIFLPFTFYQSQKNLESNLPKLNTLLDIADSLDLKVMITLFDRVDYSPANWNWHFESLKNLMTALSSHPAILAWDIKNEPDLDFKVHSKAHGKNYVINWLKLVIQTIKEINREAPITIGWSNSKNALLLKDHVDFISFHYFDAPHDFINKIKPLISETTKTFVVSEFGKHSCNTFWNPFSNTKQDQGEYISETLRAMSTSQVKLAFVWGFTDFHRLPKSMNSFLRPDKNCAQMNMGVFDIHGEAKPALRALTPGGMTHSAILNISKFWITLVLISIVLSVILFIKIKRKK